MHSIGDRAKEARKELGLTQGKVAKRVGFAQATLSELENNNSLATKEIARLAAVLGVSALWLAEGKGQRRPDGTVPTIQNEIPKKVLALAEKLALLPDEKLKALSVLLGIRL